MLTKRQERLYLRALGSVRMEGQEPSNFAKVLMRKRLQRTLSYDEARELLRAHVMEQAQGDER